jgi:MoaA/NifB/PqqE/SkfB family radical SAM enzyme
MRFEVTTKCNYNCVICPRDRMTRRVETMRLELFKRLFDRITGETAQYNTLTFPGMGEPLMDETLEEKIGYAKRKKPDLAILMLTNGSLLSPQRFKRLEDLGVTSVRVSLYGDDAATYSRTHGVRNKRLYSKVKDSLLKIAALKKRTKLLLTFNVVKGYNEDVVERWIRCWSGIADLVEVWRPHNWVDGRDYRRVQDLKLATCGRPFKGPLQVQVDGTVNMCCFDFDGKLTLGDLRRQSLKEIFASALYRKITACHRTGDFAGSGLICEHCDQRNSNKSDVMVYNSKFDIDERVRMISTTYSKVV